MPTASITIFIGGRPRVPGPGRSYFEAAFYTPALDDIDLVLVGVPTAAQFRLRNQARPERETVFLGSGFADDGDGNPVSGTITGLDFLAEGALVATIRGIETPMPAFFAALEADASGDPAPLAALLDVYRLNVDARSADRAIGFGGRIGDDTLLGSIHDDWFTASAGNDTYVGGGGRDLIFYDTMSVGVFINNTPTDVTVDAPSGGTASAPAFTTLKPGGEADTLDGITNFHGSQFDDVIINAASDATVFDRAGDDRVVLLSGGTVFAGSGSDRFRSEDGPASLVYYDDGVDAAGPGFRGIEVLGLDAEGLVRIIDPWGDEDLAIGFDTLLGTRFDDRIVGFGDFRTFVGFEGNDIIEGGPGGDNTVRYDIEAGFGGGSRGVIVDLGQGFAIDSFGGRDTLINIQHARGTPFNDVLIGSGEGSRLEAGPGDDVFFSSSGRDTLDGGPGFDTVDYAASPAGVLVNLASGTGRRGHAAGDRYVSIERVIGSEHADVLWGNDQSNVLEGGAGNDFLRAGGGDNFLFGGPGDDRLVAGPGSNLLDGGSGVDTVRYHRSTAGVTVDLGAGTGSGGWAEGDRLVSIENLVGSVHDDVLIGSPDQNVLQGLAGDDVLVAVAGDNFLFGGAGADRLVAGTGNDRMRGGADADTFVFGPDHGFNTIRDFQRRVDRIEIVGEDGPASFDDLTITSVRFGTRIDYADTRILLENIFRTDLVTESLFDFV